MERENEMIIESDETNAKSLFAILLAFGVGSIVFFSLCLIYGIIYFILNLIKSL